MTRFPSGHPDDEVNMEFKDELNIQSDKRKIEALGIDVSNAPILSISECCGAEMFAKDTDALQLYCDKCKQPCEGAEE